LRPVVDRPPRRAGEIPVEVEGTLRDPGLGVDPEGECDPLVDVADAHDLVHPGRERGVAVYRFYRNVRESAERTNLPRAAPGIPAAMRRMRYGVRLGPRRAGWRVRRYGWGLGPRRGFGLLGLVLGLIVVAILAFILCTLIGFLAFFR